MNMDKHSQASVMAGIIDNLSGSANYLNHKADTTKASVTLVCRITTRKECLDLLKIASQQNIPRFTNVEDYDSTKLTEATHIVVGVTYGAEFYCVLTQDLDEEAGQETREQIEINLSKLARQMGTALENNQDFARFEYQWPSNLNCRLYADLQTQDGVSSGINNVYECCLELIKQMQKATSITESKAIPITVRLSPLKSVTSFVMGICKVVEYRDVGADLVARIFRLWSEVEKLENKESHALANINPICQSAIGQFFVMVIKYKKILRAKLKQCILAARYMPDGSDAKVEEVVEMTEINVSKLERWLCSKHEESEIATNIAKTTGLVLLSGRNQLSEKLVAKKHTLVLFIPPLDKLTNKILQNIKHHVDSELKIIGNSIEQEGELPWYLSHQETKQNVFAKIRQLANHAKINKHLESQVQFCIAFDESQINGIESSYSIYKHYNILKEKLERLPGPPSGLRIDHDLTTTINQLFLINLKWEYKALGYPCQFLVQFRLKGQSDESWVQLKKTKVDETQTTIKIERRPAMEIRVAADTCIGRSEFSDVIDTEFEFPDTTASLEGGQGSLIGRKLPGLMQSPNFPIEKQNLIDSAADTRRIAEVFVTESDYCQLIKQGQPNVYQLNMTENSMSSDLRWFQIGRPNSDRDHKVIILMGATGSGKSTLIDGMVNYILGVKWADPFRFKSIREDNAVTRNQAHSQTSSVTAYTINHHEGMALDYSITLIDTPGYGDTRGIERDKEITQLIHRFLMQNDAKVDEIHAACFVAASGDSRLTATQRYILNSVLSIFGKDFKENIRLLVTFADNATPPVVEACRVANFPVTSESAGITYSKFNSSVLYAFNKEKGDFNFDQLFWDMGQENFTKFFAMLNGMNGKDLKSTRQVIQHRKLLEESLKEIERELEKYFVQIENLRWGHGQKGSVVERSNQMKANMLTLLNEMSNSIRSLESSALHWSGFSLSDYLSLMSSRVAEEQKPGYEIRLETLSELQRLILTQETNLPVPADKTPVPRPVNDKKWFYIVAGVVGAVATTIKTNILEELRDIIHCISLIYNEFYGIGLPDMMHINPADNFC